MYFFGICNEEADSEKNARQPWIVDVLSQLKVGTMDLVECYLLDLSRSYELQFTCNNAEQFCSTWPDHRACRSCTRSGDPDLIVDILASGKTMQDIIIFANMYFCNELPKALINYPSLIESSSFPFAAFQYTIGMDECAAATPPCKRKS